MRYFKPESMLSMMPAHWSLIMLHFPLIYTRFNGLMLRAAFTRSDALFIRATGAMLGSEHKRPRSLHDRAGPSTYYLKESAMLPRYACCYHAS